jgi:protein gp37
MDTGFTTIEWTGTHIAQGMLLPGYTFNPWIGCTNVSPGCDHCYAEALMDTWLAKVKWGPGQERVRTSEQNWEGPVKWNKRAAAEGVRRKVFCASLADVFDNEVPSSWRADLFELIFNTPALDWLLLTKRIGNATTMISDALGDNMRSARVPLPNVWLGATVVNQEEADRDIPKLLATPAAVWFLSIEPILGPISFLWASWHPFGQGPAGSTNHLDGLRRIDWVIVGGESGPKARDTEVAWIESIVHQCKAASVPVFVKQLGDRPMWVDHEPDLSEPPYFMRFNYGKKGADIDSWPAKLRVREFPR